MEQIIYIKNMVCPRCIRVVKEDIQSLGYKTKNIKLGEASISADTAINIRQIRKKLIESGFELLEDKQIQCIEKIRNTIVDAIQNGKKPKNINFSDYLSQELGKAYNTLSALFSAHENQTIEKFIINQKIEKIKELLVYEELTLSEIAWQLDYSSLAHLSNQFKQVTGLTPTHFKKGKKERKSLDQL